MSGDWKRPESVPLPSIWSRFEGKKEINGKIPKFWIQDIPEDMFEEAVNIMCANFVYDEPMSKYSKIAEDPISIKEVKEIWKELLQNKVGIICFMENPDINGKPIIAGLNMTYVSTKNEKPLQCTGKKARKIFDAVHYVVSLQNVFEKLGIEAYMGALGLSVLPEFRGQGIGDELLKAREVLGKAVGLKATLTLFTAKSSQKIASRVGFKDIIEISYDELEKIDPTFKFPGITEHTPSMNVKKQGGHVGEVTKKNKQVGSVI